MALISQFTWFDEQTWPNDSPSHFFLARAVDLVGRRLFDEDWTGDEPHPERNIPWSLPLKPVRWAYEEALSILKQSGIQSDLPDPSPRLWSVANTPGTEHLSARRKRQLGLGSYLDQEGPCPFTEEQWRVAVGLREVERQEARQINETRNTRLTSVKSVVRDAAASDALVTTLRAELGGEAKIPIPSSVWMTEPARYDHWFQRCAMNRDDPYRPIGLQSRWIFIERISLGALLASLEVKERAERRTHTGNRKIFKKELRDRVAASPQRRNWPAPEMKKRARDLSMSEPQMRLAFKEVMQEFDATAQRAWTSGGRPATGSPIRR